MGEAIFSSVFVFLCISLICVFSFTNIYGEYIVNHKMNKINRTDFLNENFPVDDIPWIIKKRKVILTCPMKKFKNSDDKNAKRLYYIVRFARWYLIIDFVLIVLAMLLKPEWL